MVFYGAYARGRRCRGDAARVQESEALASLIRAGWSRPGPAYRRVFTTLFLPDGHRSST
jgi:hypothetical protein